MLDHNFVICIADSLTLLQHVETIRAPCSWESLKSRNFKEVTWEEKQFEVRELFTLT